MKANQAQYSCKLSVVIEKRIRMPIVSPDSLLPFPKKRFPRNSENIAQFSGQFALSREFIFGKFVYGFYYPGRLVFGFESVFCPASYDVMTWICETNGALTDERCPTGLYKPSRMTNLLNHIEKEGISTGKLPEKAADWLRQMGMMLRCTTGLCQTECSRTVL